MKIILSVMAVLPYIYEAFTLALSDERRKKPLPGEVADIYDPQRYREFLNYKHDLRGPHLLSRALSLVMILFFIWSPFFAWMEKLSSNLYLLGIMTAFLQQLIDAVIGLPFAYHRTFVIREKYGLNKASRKEFFKDQALEQVFSMVVSVPLYAGMAFLIEKIPVWTDHFHASYVKAFGIMAAVFAAVGLFLVGAAFLSWFVMRRQYTFTELEEGELKDKIRALCIGSRKKIQKIEVYNESSKSTSKNAFLLKLLWVRRFGIADNFLNENSERQLLGVLAHEAGHLKHRKTLWNYVWYLLVALFPLALFLLMTHGAPLIGIGTQLKAVFGVKQMNPVLLETAVSLILTPLFSAIGVYRSFMIRSEEYEADRNAVAEGYGEDLIATFKEVSHDELVDVNPHPLIEALEYDHPGMYRRIVAIRTAIADNGD